LGVLLTTKAFATTKGTKNAETHTCHAMHGMRSDRRTRHFDELAWKPLMEDFLNPGISTSLVRGWTNYQDDVRHQYVWQWQGQWESDKGEIATYALRSAKP